MDDHTTNSWAIDSSKIGALGIWTRYQQYRITSMIKITGYKTTIGYRYHLSYEINKQVVTLWSKVHVHVAN